MDFLTDNEIDSMFDEPEVNPSKAVAIAPMPPPVPLYPLTLAQAPGAPAAANGQPANGQQTGVIGFVRKKWGPLPGWAWLLLGGGVAGTGYFFLQSRKAKPNDGGDDGESSRPKIGDVLTNKMDLPRESSGGWSPSRSSFAESLEQYYKKKGMSDQATVWHDADDAKKKGKMAFVSPLINVEAKKGGAVKVDAALTRFCRREGLNPVAHQDGNIGLYPHSSKRGKEWEEYIDALRDEGQTV